MDKMRIRRSVPCVSWWQQIALVGRLLRLKSPDEREGMKDEEEGDAGDSDERKTPPPFPPAGLEIDERSRRRQECG